MKGHWTQSESDGSLFLPLQLRTTKNTDTAFDFSIPRLLKETTLIPVNLSEVGRIPFNLFQRNSSEMSLKWAQV